MSGALPLGMAPQELARLHEVAADWLVRRQQAGWTGADERALNAWLEQQTLHREIFEGMSHNWQRAPALKAMFPDEFGSAAAGAASPAKPQLQPRQPSRPRPVDVAPRARPAWGRPALASAMLALVLAVSAGAWYQWDNTAGYTLQAATLPGETRDIALPDGSHIALNVGSRLQVHYYPRRREVVLDAGEAFFRVAADASRPFTVDAGPSQVRVVGTAFNVRAAPPRLVVQVLEGQVRVTADRKRPEAGTLLLAAGAGVAVDPLTGQRRMVPAEPDTVGDWRSGQVQFSRAPLDEVAAELARYLGSPVVLADPALAQQRVSGLLATRAPERFLQALPGLLPVQVQPAAQGGWRISLR